MADRTAAVCTVSAETLPSLFIRIAPLLSAALGLFGCSGGASTVGGPDERSVAPLPPPIGIHLDLPPVADQGAVVTVTGYLRRLELPVPARVLVDFGDGTSRQVAVGGGGDFSVQHAYARAGSYSVIAVATAVGLSPNAVEHAVVVHPRHIVFIQGVNSSSSCPDGSGFLTRAPRWLQPELVAQLAGTGLLLSSDQFSYFSYSGRYCGLAGSPPDYEAGDTCASLSDVQATRLVTLVNAIGPGKVTLVGYSMGGLLAAYTVAANPDWARERIASVVTLDSPLGGIGLSRTGVLGAGGIFDSDCGPRSAALAEMGEGSSTVRMAALAPTIVAVYTIDATSAESGTLGRAEAVPGSASTLPGVIAHIEVPQRHSAVWNDPGDPDDARVRFVVCAILVANVCP